MTDSQFEQSITLEDIKEVLGAFHEQTN